VVCGKANLALRKSARNDWRGGMPGALAAPEIRLATEGSCLCVHIQEGTRWNFVILKMIGRRHNPCGLAMHGTGGAHNTTDFSRAAQSLAQNPNYHGGGGRVPARPVSAES